MAPTACRFFIGLALHLVFQSELHWSTGDSGHIIHIGLGSSISSQQFLDTSELQNPVDGNVDLFFDEKSAANMSFLFTTNFG